MKYFIAILFLLLPILAHGATCVASLYWENGCKWCPTKHYCPGDDEKYQCPPGNNVGIWNIETRQVEGATKIEMCIDYATPHTFDHGTGTVRCYYNPDTEQYDASCHLSKTLKCDAGYYSISFTKFLPLDGVNYSETDCVPVGLGFYSPVDDLNRYQCPDGYTTHTETASECIPLCAAGATKFHVGNYVFNIYKDKLTTPAINIGLSDGTVCYVSLVEGPGKGALNVDYKGTVYHTSN